MATKIETVFVMILTLISLSLLGSSLGQGSDHLSRSSRNRPRHRPSRWQGLPTDLEAEYLNALTPTVSTPTTLPPQEEERSVSAVDPWRRFIPNTPTASEVNCHFDVMVTRRQGGRCIRLGGAQRKAVCQSGPAVAFVPDCENILSAREALTNLGTTTPEQ